MPTSRSAAASPTIPASTVQGPPQSDATRSRGSGPALNGWWFATEELGDVSGVDDHGVHARAFEGEDGLAARHRHVRDGELARWDVRKEVERLLERVAVVVTRAARQEQDLGIDALERLRELFL